MTRQNVTEGVREIMTRHCPTCEGEGVIRSEETIAIEFERRLRDVAAEHPDAEAFLVQANPRVSTQFTGNGSRVLHALEAETGKSFLFEGSEGLALDHFAITFTGTRERGRGAGAAVPPGRRGAGRDRRAAHVRRGRRRRQDRRLHHLDRRRRRPRRREADDPHRPGRPHGGQRAAARRGRRGRRRAGAARETRRRAGPRKAPARLARGAGAGRRRTASADREDSEARAEAGLAESSATIEEEPDQPGTNGATPEAERRSGRGWPTIQTSASWPQRRATPFRCQGEGSRVASPRKAPPEHTCTRS